MRFPEALGILARNLTQPMRYDSVENQFRAWRESLGDAQIQAITNQSPQTVAYYRKRASRKKLSRSAWGGPGTQER